MADLTDVYTALQNADAAGDSASAKQLADYIRSQGDDSSPQAAPQPSGYDSFLRQTALAGRAVGQGVVGALTLPNTIMTGAGNAAIYAGNHLFGMNRPYKPTLQQVLSGTLNQLGAPQPQTSGENLTSAAIEGGAGALAGGGAAGLSGLNAVRAGASGVTGSLSSEVARQSGLPPWLQFGAGLIGGQVPAALESTGTHLR